MDDEDLSKGKLAYNLGDGIRGITRIFLLFYLTPRYTP
jgi:hypothetical protein